MIECLAVSKRYASRTVLTSLDLALEPGICALLGANGAGKSTLLRLLSGIERPGAGTVLIDGMSFGQHALEIRRNLGVLPEGLGLFESLSVIENLMAVGPIYGLTRQETWSRSTNLLELLDLADGRHTLARDCSFGMRKKTAFGMALLHNPRVLLLDEPFEGIDPASSRALRLLFRQLADKGATILFTSHILPIVQTISDRVIILRNGSIASDFSPVQSPAQPAQSVEAAYFSLLDGAPAEVPDWLRS